MPGTLVRDSNATNLLTGSTLNAAGTTTSTAVQIDKPGEIQFVLTTGTVTGTSPTGDFEVKGADDSGMSTNVVSYGRFSQRDTTDGVTKYLRARVDSKYVQVTVILGGTNPVFTGSTLYARMPNDRRTQITTSA
ncbi:MAG TPA: hypothetical protein VJQ57_09285 [Acidimicrobiia bacterium]|nr:hypothetical protein [Acidimicrobiia bacterium]